MKKYWVIKGYDGANELFNFRKLYGCKGTEKIQTILKTLVSKMALGYDEIIDSGLNEKSRGKLNLLDVRRQRDGSFICGDNPFVTARVIEE